MTIDQFSALPLTKPYRDESVNFIYHLLFCDHPALYHSDTKSAALYPWDVLFAEAEDINALNSIIDDPAVESRVKLLAFQILREKGKRIDKKELLGVIIEVGLDEGLDVLAAYRDGTARYINYTGQMIILEAAQMASDMMIRQLFADSEQIISKIGPWDKPRRPHPARGIARLTFLVSDGLYFGEGPITILFNDQLAGPALMSATKLMQFLTEGALNTHTKDENTRV